MELETSARIAILGAGPIGLETALYARSLGYQVAVYEREQVAGNVRRWGHVRMFSPFRMNASSLGLAALAAQDPAYKPPDPDALLTGNEWYEHYLRPLSKTDLLAGCIHESNRVLAIGRSSCLKSEHPGGEQRADSDFRILMSGQEGKYVEGEYTESEYIATAGAVIDTTGVFRNPNWAGQGGIPAIGEQASRPRIETGMPDVLNQQRADYAGRRILVVGSGYSAATNVVALCELGKEEPKTSVTWITRRDAADAENHEPDGPIRRIPEDRLAERDALAVAANHCVTDDNSPARHLDGTMLERVDYDTGSSQFSVQLVGRHAGEEVFDRIITNVGYQPDGSIYSELQVHQCYASDGPMKLAAALLGATSADCLDQSSHGAQTLLNPEPNFYILGAKSYGRNSQFLVSVGLRQIQELFTILGGRADLDLYASVEHLVP